MNSEIVEFYNGYLEKLSVENNRHEKVLDSIDTFIPQNTKVLDIGCGTGITSRYLAKGDRNVVAIDCSPVLIDHAKKMNSHFGRVEYVVGDACDFFPDKAFDAVVLVDVLEHVQTTSIRRLFSVLRHVSHETTKIYLNIPSAQTIRWLKKNRPELLQIVDEPIETEEILEQFSRIGFIPSYFQFYWQQYVEYLFVTKDQYNKTLQGAF
jgi:2-polyprenyl-3-methyl-5-hydroxy-6-metoxy-1,4-benzoquinol methylase